MRNNTKELNNKLDAILTMLGDMDSRITKLEQAQASKSKVSTPKSQPKKTASSKVAKSTTATVEKVAYTKADGTTVMATPAQIAAWDAWKSREHMSLEELKAIPMPKISKKVRTWVKAHPSASTKEVKAQFPEMRGLRKEQLRELKVELGVRSAR